MTVISSRDHFKAGPLVPGPDADVQRKFRLRQHQERVVALRQQGLEEVVRSPEPPLQVRQLPSQAGRERKSESGNGPVLLNAGVVQRELQRRR